MLSGKVALITGAGGGIGSATSSVFLREHAKVALVDSNSDALARSADQLIAHGYTADAIETYVADVTSAADVQAYVQATRERFGKLDVLFNNAGTEGDVAFTADYDESTFDRVMSVNIKGVWLNLKYGISAMLEQGTDGVVINTSSGLGLVGMPGLSAYVATKHAVTGLTRTAALEYGSRGVRVVAVCPGPIATAMMDALEEKDTSQSREASHEAFVNYVPLKRYGTPAEIAELVAFLASDRASFINGSAVSIDGGTTAG